MPRFLRGDDPGKIPKKVLVLFWDLVKVTATMKRLSTLIVLLGLTIGALLTGCSQSSDTGTTTTDTNAPAAPPSTNAPAK